MDAISLITEAPTRPTWRFAVGDIVDHVLGGMLGRVKAMERTTAGRQLFAVELMEEDDRPLRIMRSDYLVPVSEGKRAMRPLSELNGSDPSLDG